MSDWTTKWKAKHANFVKGEKTVKSVLEHRYVENGEIYALSMNGGGFEVRHYEGGKLKKSTKFPKGTAAIKAYRELRDNLVPNRAKAEVAPKPKATAKATPKAKAKK